MPCARPGRGAGWRALRSGWASGCWRSVPGCGGGSLLSYDMLFVPREPFSAAWPGQAPPRAVPSDLVIAAPFPGPSRPTSCRRPSCYRSSCSPARARPRCWTASRWRPGSRPGCFYAWNPYVGERLIIGQWALLLGYGGLPWVLRAVLAPGLASRRGAARLGLALAPAVIGGFAAMAITALVVVPAALLGRSARRAAVALGALAAGSLPWLIPSVLHPVYVDPASVAAFAARADRRSAAWAASWHAGRAWNTRTVPAAYGGAWSALWRPAVVIIALGGYLLRARPGRRWPGLGVAAAAGLAIAGLGVTAPGRDLLRAMIGAWPGFATARDAQQFVAPLALAAAAGLGVVVAGAMKPGSFGRERDGPVRRDAAGTMLGAVAILAPVLLLPGLAWGAAGRLRPAVYPAGWVAAARVVDGSAAPGRVLLLPWETYRTFGWNHGEAVLDPWTRLLSRPLVWDDGTRVGHVELEPDDPLARRGLTPPSAAAAR